MDSDLRHLAVLGGTSNIGYSILCAALDSGHFRKVHALIRDYQAPNAVRDRRILDIESKGGKVVRVNVKDREAIKETLQDFDAVVSLQGTDDVQETKDFIDDCVAAGVKRFIPNVFGVDYTVNALPWLTPRKETHAYLAKQTSLTYTEIVCGFFADVDNLGHPSILGISWNPNVARYTGEEASRPVSFTFRKDVGTIVIEALKSPAVSRNRILRIEGDRLSLNELVSLYEKVSNTTFEKREVSKSDVWEGPLLSDDFDWGSESAMSPFVKMALRGTAIVNPSGEAIDNSLFPNWKPTKMTANAEESWNKARTEIAP